MAALGGAVRARLRSWPYDPDVAQLVLVDHSMVPDADDVRRWIESIEQRGSLIVRTGALFPHASRAFLGAGFTIIDTLALLDVHLDEIHIDLLKRTSTKQVATTSRMRHQHIDELAELDRRAFGDPWGNDAASLTDITTATPRHRARVIKRRSGLAGYAISGLAGTNGYVQRLAVHPDAQGGGHGRSLLVDGLAWMQRRGATRAMVNTGVDNQVALQLYASCGFERCTEQLVILETTLRG